jgi:hypothetical protein
VTQEEYYQALLECGDWGADRGLSILAYKAIDKRNDFIKVVIKNEIFYRSV